ncbi:hypothetical protein [Actinospongicola halichondriae]|uniref:hypothetical protein n=1 Tax=Actinospongicola halichondriae TaxID=3236844 RepID=UPI003D5B7F21
MQRLPRRYWIACVGVFFVGVGLRLVADAVDDLETAGETQSSVSEAALRLLEADAPTVRTVDSYDGLGIWVDAFDFEPGYQGEGGGPPPLTPAVVDDFAAVGVETVYLQAARRDDRAPGLLLDEGLLAEFLLRAHARDIDVVGWYLPLFDDVDADVERLVAIADFAVRGHRFDGVAVDIEYIEAVPDAEDRSGRLVHLSQELRKARPDDALGAIVPPAVQLEVVNTAYWPRFPWRDLDRYYDVWMPMAYWTVRTEASGYRDAYRYAEESTRRMRANLGRDDARVHIIGGIGDETTTEDLDGLRHAIEDTASIGGSIYDWQSLSPERRAELPASIPG